MTEPRQPHESGSWLGHLHANIATRIHEVTLQQEGSEASPAPPKPYSQPSSPGSSLPAEPNEANEIAKSSAPSVSQDVRSGRFHAASPAVSSSATDATGDTLRTRSIQEVLGDYELLEEIARGSVGVVFRARQISLGRIVAVKVIQSGHLATPEEVRRFYAEAEAAASLHHPHIVPIYEVGSARGVHFFSMRYVEGGSLAEHQARLRGKWFEIARLLATVAQAVDYAHRHGVLHRDLKPANILLDAEGQPAISDFGLCKRLAQPSDGREDLLVGTPLYMAPEQIDHRFGHVSVASDIYSLGAILYELLTGQPPFPGQSVEEVFPKVLNDEPTPPSRYRADVPRDLAAICLKCLRKNPKERYSSAYELADDLERFLHGDPVRARPVGLMEQCWRWSRRHPATAVLTLGSAVLGGIAVLAILVVAVLVAWREAKNVERLEHLNREAVAAKDEADKHRQRTLAILRETELQRRQTQRLAAELACLQAMHAFTRQEIPTSLFWLTRALEWLGDSEDAEVTALRRLLASWQSWTHRLVCYGRLPERWRSVALHPKELVVLGVNYLDQPFIWNLAHEAQPRRIPVEMAQLREVRFLATEQALWFVSPQGWQIWDIHGKQMLDRWESKSPVTAWALDHDGATWAVSDQKHNVYYWHGRTGAESPARAELLARWQLPYPVSTLAVAGETRTVFARTRVGIWLLRPDSSPRSDKPDMVLMPTRLAVSAQAHRMIYGSTQGYVRICDLTGDLYASSPLNLGGECHYVFMSRDGGITAALGAEGVFRLWDVSSQSPMATPLDGCVPIRAADVSPDGQRLATVSEDSTLRVWKLADRTAWHRQLSLGTLVERAIFDHQASHLAVVSGPKLLLYRRHKDHSWHQVMHWNTASPIVHWGLNRDGTRLFVASQDGRITVWDVPDSPKMRMTTGAGEAPTLVAWDEPGRYLAYATKDRQITVWDLSSMQLPGATRLSNGAASALAWSHDGSWYAVGLDNGVICVGRPSQVHQPPVSWLAHSGPITALTFTPTSRHLISAGANGKVLVWDVSKSRLIWTLAGHAAPIRLLAGAAGSDYVFSGGRDYFGAVHDVARGQSRWLMGSGRHEWLLSAFSPTGEYLATVNSRPSLEIWHSGQGYRVTPPLLLPASARACQWLSAEEVAVVCQDGRLLTWRLPPPVSGDAESLMARWQQLTGLQLVGVTVHPISPEQWQQLRWQLGQENSRHATKVDIMSE
ncbi:MAG: serine/threonine-protein kinase [Gemmatales bacterium]|nr:serine/threonine-protein kinase [Gemmatales bacterium]MDW8223479.1 WD40 repeat domain-containing serine/threonine-protein kinase [Gemmatales bacterium]